MLFLSFVVLFPTWAYLYEYIKFGVPRFCCNLPRHYIPFTCFKCFAFPVSSCPFNFLFIHKLFPHSFPFILKMTPVEAEKSNDFANYQFM